MAVWTSYVGLLLGWTQRPFGLMPCSGRTIIWFLRVTPIGNCNYLSARPYLIPFFFFFLSYFIIIIIIIIFFISFFLPFSRVRIISVPFGRQFIANVKGMVIVPFLWLVGCFFFNLPNALFTALGFGRQSSISWKSLTLIFWMDGWMGGARWLTLHRLLWE